MKRYRERCEVLETSYRETVEDHLRVALIRSGDSVIIMNEVVLKQYIYCDLENKKGGTARILVPFCQADDRKRAFFLP